MPTPTRRRVRRRKKRRARAEMKMALNPCLLIALASYCPPPTREYILCVCVCVYTHIQAQSIVPCYFLEYSKVIVKESFSLQAKTYFIFNVFWGFFVFYFLTCTRVCVSAPGFGSAVTTSWLWSILSSPSLLSSLWAASLLLQRTLSTLSHRKTMWDTTMCLCFSVCIVLLFW